jgi:hypothetical protein
MSRVEDRLAPALPHQTVDAVFPHMAFRCSSHSGNRGEVRKPWADPVLLNSFVLESAKKFVAGYVALRADMSKGRALDVRMIGHRQCCHAPIGVVAAR